ncbi:glycoside hydrolase family 104 protein [Geomonas nitrogeniifigens]|uniref:Glycoside hydrolase family 104 protein n=1 Tax=Geomonas diazotrophica TaxID=2843197 RepID=A0ABX8JFP5_9BACT|nr:glycoside hydrolase family 104 protein [Geomonas nitrogeniifigens]QWV97210.1 glycoside hydrolase family 104 protein [Geomonas nitrogeniifigens]
MAGSRQFHSHRDPFQRPSLTPGPLGHNDAASPDTPRSFVGDTPGPLGVNDHAEPNPRLLRGEVSRAGCVVGGKVTSQRTITELSSEEELVKDPRVKALLDVVAYAEGADYDTMVKGVGSVPINDFSKHPNVVVVLSKSLKSTAAGRYQFLYSTWIGLKMPDFSPLSQDKAAIRLFKRRNMLKPLFSGDIEQAIRNGNREWASLPGSPYGQPTRNMRELLKVYSTGLLKWSKR